MAVCVNAVWLLVRGLDSGFVFAATFGEAFGSSFRGLPGPLFAGGVLLGKGIIGSTFILGSSLLISSSVGQGYLDNISAQKFILPGLYLKS